MPPATGSMIHGRQNGVSLNFQDKRPSTASPKITPIIFGSIFIVSNALNEKLLEFYFQ
jgi:hypothetical protein